ncbi:MFS transporter [Planctomycetes bacterium Pan216]
MDSLVGLLPGLATIMLHSAMIDIARADVIDGLGTDKYRIAWINTTYLLGGASGMALTRFCASRWGLRGSYLVALVLFVIANITSSLAPNVRWLAASRLVGGVGMGLAISSAMVMVWRAFPGRRGMGMAIYACAVYIPALLGPTIGGYLTYTLGWRSIFLLDVVLGLGAFVCAELMLPEEPGPRKPLALDVVGFILLLGWILSLNVVLDWGQYLGWLNSLSLLLWLATFLVAFGSFVVWGLLAENPLISLRPFGLRNVALGIAIKSIVSANLYVVIALLSSYMIGARLYQWWQGGLILFPAALAMFLSANLGAVLGSDRDRRWRMLLGIALMALMTWRLSAVDLYTAKGWLALQLGSWGFGAGLVISPTLVTIFQPLNDEQALRSAGIFNISRSIPAFIVGALATISLTQTTDSVFDRRRLEITRDRPIVAETTGALDRQFRDRGQSPEQRKKQARASLGGWTHRKSRADAYQAVFVYLALFTAAGAGLALFVRPMELSREENRRPHGESASSA